MQLRHVFFGYILKKLTESEFRELRVIWQNITVTWKITEKA